ncbi:hypothetical protein ONS95_011309 [Cadophora gregata]|uniref:uncharacterized protein n=1 Tax=Cadophora gregata TaxID=51156 RepID=UPI0026DCC6CC|nr:uncharacterized protein ONS95_011309 [Cadophora gregata]KAK0119879.1 hypothetical protein ONS95_011309 [Cadophora gregata]KAK0120915.1 hypothetical protein ONS96_011112 [Cadophora gregata f. sp. sojae]
MRRDLKERQRVSGRSGTGITLFGEEAGDLDEKAWTGIEVRVLNVAEVESGMGREVNDTAVWVETEGLMEVEAGGKNGTRMEVKVDMAMEVLSHLVMDLAIIMASILRLFSSNLSVGRSHCPSTIGYTKQPLIQGLPNHNAIQQNQALQFSSTASQPLYPAAVNVTIASQVVSGKLEQFERRQDSILDKLESFGTKQDQSQHRMLLGFDYVDGKPGNISERLLRVGI